MVGDPRRLTAEVLEARTVELFPNAYLTLLSVVQGVALGAIVTRLPGVTAATLDTRFAWWQVLTTGIAVVVVYYNYVWFVVIARWAPTVADTVIPFLLGGLEVAVAVTIGTVGLWIGWLAVLNAGGIGAFIHSLWRTNRSTFEGEETFRRIIRLLQGLCAALVVDALTCVKRFRFGGQSVGGFPN